MELIESTQNIIERKKSIFNTLKNIIYPDASLEAVNMVFEYCIAANLDPLKKPVYIVPLNTYNKATKKYETRETIMPGIALYRIEAARTGELVGIGEPEFGPMITTVFESTNGEYGDKLKKEMREFTHPEWCRIVVKRLVKGVIGEFVGFEYWLENYASKSKQDKFPNNMWETRKHGQLAKCAESQALRKAAPESTGGTVTAEEMEGKEMIINGNFNLHHEQNSALKKLSAALVSPEELPEWNKLVDAAAEGTEALKLAWVKSSVEFKHTITNSFDKDWSSLKEAAEFYSSKVDTTAHD